MAITLIIKNCKLYDRTPDSDQIDIHIENGRISRIVNSGTFATDAPSFDAGGKTACPGFIDVHIQGAGGSDILDNTPESITTIGRTLARAGTTAYLGTTVVKPETQNAHLRLARSFTGKLTGGAVLLGVHIEGPFINIAKKGGLSPDAIYPSSPHALDEIFEATGDSLKMMTIAPELPGNLEIIRELVRQRVVAAFAHSDADYDQTLSGFDAGIDHITHIFNAMPPLHHRQPGPLTAIFEHPSITAQIISDGHHLHPRIVDLISRLLGKHRCVCITDGMQAQGLPEGRYLYNGKEYEAKNGAARYLDGTLIGSTMSLGAIALKFMEFTRCTLREAIDTVSIVPARVLGIDSRKGSLDAGKDADIVLLDENLSVSDTFIAGAHVPALTLEAGG